MKTINILFLAVAISLTQTASSQNLATTIKVQAMEMGTALVRNDFNTFVKFMHPDIITYAGGKEAMKLKMDSAFLASKRFKVSVEKYWIGSPGEIIKYKNTLQALLPQSTTLKTPLGEMIVETTMIVISPDNGKSWWFIDTNVYSLEKMKDVLPDLSPKLVVPPMKKPVLKRKGGSN